MKKNLKKSMALLLGTSLIVSSMMYIPVDAQDNAVDYVAFGDSIAYGYGLEDTNDGCVSLVGEYLNADVSNYAINGLTSEGLIEILDSGVYDDSIANAEVITITIGSNDILIPFIKIVSETIGVNVISDTAMQEWYNTTDIFTKITLISQLNQTLTDNETLNTACENFKDNTFPTIINDIKELNPDCEIVVTNFYNPYYDVNLSGMLDLGTLTDNYIKKLNSALDTTSTDYKVANVYDGFKTDGLTNVDTASYNLDPHPNVEGHKLIADTIIENLDTKPAIDIGTSDKPTIVGDVNKDGKTNLLDILLLKKYILGLLDDDSASNYNLDVNKDGSVSGHDLLMLKQMLLGIIS